MSDALNSYRKALDLTLEARAALLAENLDRFIEVLSSRAGLIQSGQVPAAESEQIRAIIVQMQHLDGETLDQLNVIRRGLVVQQADVRRARATQSAYGLAPAAQRGARLQRRG